MEEGRRRKGRSVVRSRGAVRDVAPDEDAACTGGDASEDEMRDIDPLGGVPIEKRAPVPGVLGLL